MSKMPYKRAYQELAGRCYVVVASYEKYLLNNLTSQELAVVMKDLLDRLPPISRTGREALRSPETPEEEWKDQNT